MTITNLRLMPRNLFDEAVISVTDSVTPVQSLQQSRRTRWRSATDQTQVIRGELPDYGFADGICIAHHNLTAGARWRLILREDDQESWDSGWLETVLYIPVDLFLPGVTPWMASYNDKLPVPMVVHWLPEPIPFRQFEIHLSPAAGETCVEASRIFLGQSFSPRLNMEYGCELTYEEQGEHRRSDAQGLWTIGRGVSRRFALDLNWLDAPERSQLALELVSQGIQQDLLISAYPGEGGVLELEHTLIAKRANPFASVHSGFDTFATRLEFIES